MLNSLFGGGELGPAAAARGPGHDFQAEFDRAEAERLRARSANPDAFPALPAGRRSEGGLTVIDGDVDAPAPRHHRPAETDTNVEFRSEFPTLGAPSAARAPVAAKYKKRSAPAPPPPDPAELARAKSAGDRARQVPRDASAAPRRSPTQWY